LLLLLQSRSVNAPSATTTNCCWAAEQIPKRDVDPALLLLLLWGSAQALG
jgi:hypothetical protein